MKPFVRGAGWVRELRGSIKSGSIKACEEAMCLLPVALMLIGATPLRFEDSDELCAQLLRIDDTREDQWIQHKCKGKTACIPRFHFRIPADESFRRVQARSARRRRTLVPI